MPVRSAGSQSGSKNFSSRCRRQHVGLYAYRRSTLEAWNALPESRLAVHESLKQLRAVEAGIPMAAAAIHHAARGIDTPKDYAAFVARQRAGG